METNNYWKNIEKELPPQDEEVIVLTGSLNLEENYQIAFGHIVNKEYCVDYNGWNIPNVKYWIPCPKIKEN